MDVSDIALSELAPPPVYSDPVRIEWKMIADLRCEIPEIPVLALANRVGRTPTTVHIWLKQPRYQAYENWVFEQKKQRWTPFERAVRADVQDTLQEHASEQLERLLLIAETTQDEKLAAGISQDLLDRAGHAAQRKLESHMQAFVLTEGAMRVLVERFHESKGEVVVGEVVER